MSFAFCTRPNLPRFVVLFAIICSFGIPARAAGDAPDPKKDKFVLVYKAQVGQVRRGKGTANLNMEPAGQKVNLEIRETGKATYTKVAPNGDITFEETTETSETFFNGEKDTDPDDRKEVRTYVIRPTGDLVSLTSTSSDKDDAKFAARVFYASNPVYSTKPVGVGDKWTVEVKGNDDLGTRNGKAEFELTATEKIGETDAVRLKFTYAESASGGISSKGSYVVEKESGDVLSSSITIEGLPLGPPGMETPASGTLVSERIEGRPLPTSKNVAVKPDDKKPEPKKEKTIDEIVKEYEKIPGIFTLYRKKESTKETIYLEIPEDKFGKLLLLQTTAGTGNTRDIVPGDPISDTLFMFVKGPDDKILIKVPNWRYRATPGSPTARAAKRSFADAYLQSFKVEAKQADRKGYLIDISDFFRSDFAQISQALNGGDIPIPGVPGGGAPRFFSLDREKTYIQTIKNFPENLVVYTQYHFTRSGRGGNDGISADSRSLPLLVVYNLIPLPNDGETFQPTNGYRPRVADPRIGYFLTEYVPIENDATDDPTVRYILRWDLRKKDPTAAMSEPEKPIVFWLDNAIPLEYREPVRKGLLVWNKAFERLGFKNAIEVKQMPDDADWDPADLRYNVIRWVVSPPDGAYAVALFRENPLTGQILNACITVDAGWTRVGKLERRELIDPVAAFLKGANMEIEAFLSGIAPLSPQTERHIKNLQEHAGHRHSKCCVMGEDLAEKAWFGKTALSLTAPEGISPEKEKEYTDQLLVETVCHEMGHILGLRHNFIASTAFSLNQLKDPSLVSAQGISASVMDYNNFNISAIKAKGVDFYSQTIGPYDYWAIEYGYIPLRPEEEAARLKQIASQSNAPGHAYQSDETVIIGVDPRVVQYDMSAEPLAYWETVMQLSRSLMASLGSRQPRTGESYYEFTKSFYGLLGQYSRAAAVVSRYIGGVKLNKNHRGDLREQPVTVPVDAADQKRALALLNTYVFSPTAFVFPERYFVNLTTDPFGFALTQDAPIADQISGIQRAALSRLFAPSVLRRIANSEFKQNGNPQKTLTLPALFNSVGDNVWAELTATDPNPRKNIPTLRRQLQRAHLDTMVDMVVKPSSVPDDAKMLAWNQLRTLKTKLLAARSVTGQDEYTRLHYTDSLDKIQRALDVKLTLGGSQGGSPMSLLQLLLGGKTQTALP